MAKRPRVEFQQWTVPPSEEVTWSDRAYELGVCLGLAVLGMVCYLAWQVLALGAVLGIEPGATEAQLTMVGPPTMALGFATAAGLYFSASRYDGSVVDVRLPDLRGLLAIAGGIGVLLALVYAVGYLFTALGVPEPQHSTIEAISTADPMIILFFVATSVLIVGPAEEFLFRNLIQKRLAETFSPAGAIALASVVFAVVHFSAYFSWNPLQLLGSLATVLVLSLVLGALFYWRRNLVEVALVHGCYNAVQFGTIYLERVGVLPGA